MGVLYRDIHEQNVVNLKSPAFCGLGF
jgi:hypothetical protein